MPHGLPFTFAAILGGALCSLVDRNASGAVTEAGMLILLVYSLLVHDEAGERPHA